MSTASARALLAAYADHDPLCAPDDGACDVHRHARIHGLHHDLPTARAVAGLALDADDQGLALSHTPESFRPTVQLMVCARLLAEAPGGQWFTVGDDLIDA